MQGNWAGYSGGGIDCAQYANPLIMNNLITDNWAGEWGGGISCYSNSYPTIANNIITGNWAERSGGGIDCRYQNVHPVIVNNTITGNGAGESGGGIRCANNAFPTIINTIFWGNNAPSNPEIYYYGSEPSVTFSDIQGGWPGEGNIDEDPLFINPNFDNYYLRSNSPCIDAGDSTILDACRPPGLGEERSDMGAYGGEENCGWPLLPAINLSIYPTGPTSIPQGGILYFNTYIQNTRENAVEGDYWLSVMFPDSSELLIPDILLNYSNPLHGQIFPYGFVDLSNEFWVHPRADTGSYQLIGRIGTYPNGIADEESFGFQVVE